MIEELSLNAWPALQTICYDGWLLRFANGYTSRANSVNPLYASSLPDLSKIRYCEQLYSAQGLNTIFKLTPANVQLDSVLEKLGYIYRNPTQVQVLDLAATSAFSGTLAISDKLNLTPILTDAWLNAVEQITHIEHKNLQILQQMLALLVPSACFAYISRENVPVAIGLAVLERKQIGLFEIATATTYRKQGLANAIVSSLLEWGRQQGAVSAYLQVVADNAPARNLYRKIGFSDSYQYWYRVKP